MGQYLTANVKRGAMFFAIIATVIGIIGVIPLLNCIALPITCVVGLFLPVGIGWFVATWDGATDMTKGAIAGATASVIGAVISGIIVFIADMLITVVFGALNTGLGGDAGSAAVGIGITAVGSFVGRVIIGPIGAAIFGAIGGLLYVAIQGNKAAPKPA